MDTFLTIKIIIKGELKGKVVCQNFRYITQYRTIKGKIQTKECNDKFLEKPKTA